MHNKIAQAASDKPAVQIILVGHDSTAEELSSYLVDGEIPFPGVRFDAKEQLGDLASYENSPTGAIPWISVRNQDGSVHFEGSDTKTIYLISQLVEPETETESTEAPKTGNTATPLEPAEAPFVSEFEFEKPIMLKAGGNPIRVENPGYAAPCWADIDGDGKSELLVGQFAHGKIKVYQHEGDLTFSPGEWLEANGKPAEVPGVW